jgi:hypothetical protein
MCPQEALYLLAQPCIRPASTPQKGNALRDRQLQRLGKKDYVPFRVIVHGNWQLFHSPNGKGAKISCRCGPQQLSLQARTCILMRKTERKRTKKVAPCLDVFPLKVRSH